MLLLTIRPWYISNCNSRSSYIKKLVKLWRILSYFFFTPWFLLFLIPLIFTNTFSAHLFDFCVGRINPGTFGAALTSRSHGHSVSSMPCLAQYCIQHLLCNHLWCHLNYPSRHSSQANLWGLKCCQAGLPHHFKVYDNWFFGFGKYWIFEFVFQGGPLHVSSLQRRCFWQFKCSYTIVLKEWPECFDDPFCILNILNGGHLVVLSTKFLLGST